MKTITEFLQKKHITQSDNAMLLDKFTIKDVLELKDNDKDLIIKDNIKLRIAKTDNNGGKNYLNETTIEDYIIFINEIFKHVKNPDFSTILISYNNDDTHAKKRILLFNTYRHIGTFKNDNDKGWYFIDSNFKPFKTLTRAFKKIEK